MRLVLYLLLVALTLHSVLLDKALNILPAKELKRRARSGHDKTATALYQVAAYQPTVDLLLWLKGSIAAAILFVMLAGHSWWLAAIFVGTLLWLVRGWQIHDTKNWVWHWAAVPAPVMAWLLVKLQPVLGRLARRPLAYRHTKVYERGDLIELLSAQAAQPDNRIAKDELAMAANALTFGDKHIGDIMTPLRQMRVVGEDEEISPLLMDELHKTGFSRFPVTAAGSQKANPQVVGTLFLKDIILKESGRVHGHMHKKVFFINETQNLRDGLNAFINNHYHLFVVVNNFEEVVGVVTIEDVLEQILGKLIIDEFDRYDDLRAVAGRDAEKDSATRAKVAVAPPAK